MRAPNIIKIRERKLIGMRIRTSLNKDKTKELWQRFKPRVKEIQKIAASIFYSVQIYEKEFSIKNFTPDTEFDKWAAVEVTDIGSVPDGMEAHYLSAGTYAVFTHQGTADSFPKTLRYIYLSWLPSSDYTLDKREHFEILGDNYFGPDDPDSEEEVWIPVKKKANSLA